MKTFVSLLAALSGIAFAATPTDPGTVPEGIAASDWADIRAAYEAGRHAAHRQESGRLIARNPGQQWRAEFDGKGFTVNPDHGTWTWGLELTGYGDQSLPPAASPSQLRHEGGKITCERDENLTEWFINDSRGLEQGWDIQQRPERADPADPLLLHLSTRGGFRPRVSTGGDSVSFHQKSGGSALTYGGLKAWDADGKKLAVRFEQAGENHIRIAVDDQSARYPITIDPVAQQARLQASNADLSDYFGSAVAVSGKTVVVAARNEDSAARGVNGDQANNGAPDSGAVYIFVNIGGTWIQQAYLKASNTGAGDQFGRSVAISGNTVIVAARDEDSSATGVNGNQTNNSALQSGAVYVFTRSGTTWTQQAYLKASNTGGGPIFGDWFGASVSVSGDTLVVGAPEEDSAATGVNGNGSDNTASGAGAAYVFSRSGTTWSQQAYLKASNANAADHFGFEVGISGNTVVVGAPRERSAATGPNGDQADNSVFGAGAAYVFTRSGTTWTQQAYLKASNTAPSSPSNAVGAQFGSSVAISGETVIVGASGEESAATGVNGDQTNKGAIGSGAAYVFTRSGTTWNQQAYLKASNTATYAHFGTSASISDETVVIGAPAQDGSGTAYVFTRNGTAWTQQALLKASDAAPSAYFGISVGISGDIAVAGAFQPDIYYNGTTTFTYTGAAYIFRLNPPAIELLVGQAGIDFANGGTSPFGPRAVGGATETSFDLFNGGFNDLLLTGAPKVAVTGSSDFTVTAQPAGSVGGPGGSTSFRVRFAPTSGGAKSAVLSVPSNDENDTPFVIHLTGTGLSYTIDTDGDGLDDASELNMAALGFDWQANQSALVSNYLASLTGGGLYTAAQIQALYPGTPLITKDPVSGRFKVTMQWEKSTELRDFYDFPAPASSSVSISPSGGIEFEFESPEKAAFFRIKQD